MSEYPDTHGEEKLIAENELCRFYTNGWTASMQKYAASRGVKGIAAMVVEQKANGTREYLLVDTSTREPVYASQSYESVGVHIDALGFVQRHEATP